MTYSLFPPANPFWRTEPAEEACQGCLEMPSSCNWCWLFLHHLHFWEMMALQTEGLHDFCKQGQKQQQQLSGRREGNTSKSAFASAAANVEHDICGNLGFVFPPISLYIYCFQTYTVAKYSGMFKRRSDALSFPSSLS